MCGRFTLSTPAEIVRQAFDLADIPPLAPRYNIAPGQDVPAVRVILAGGERQLHLLHWGLVPSWAKEPRIGYRMINARAETVATKPAFRRALRSRRCLVLADGFYEWQKLARGKQPYFIRRRDGRPFAIAGLWEEWRAPQGDTLLSCTLLTTEPNELVRQVHDRMPVILRPEDYGLWLDPTLGDVERLRPLLRPCPADEMEAYRVSDRVNRPASDDVSCIAPLDEAAPGAAARDREGGDDTSSAASEPDQER